MHAIESPSPNFDSRNGQSIDLVVLHYTGMRSAEAALRRLCDPAPKREAYRADIPAAHLDALDSDLLGRVSAHYLVTEPGRVHKLVNEDQRAWHAGVAQWAGATDINHRSIGIEIANGGHDYRNEDGGLPDYPAAQMRAVVELVAEIVERWSIPPWRVVGHSDVAPGRKSDPGEHFPWSELGERNLALSVTLTPEPSDQRINMRAGAAGDTVRRLQRRLSALGYGLAVSGGYDDRTRDVISAFQRRFAALPDDRFDGGVWTAGHERVLDAVFFKARRLAHRAQQAGITYQHAAPIDSA